MATTIREPRVRNRTTQTLTRYDLLLLAIPTTVFVALLVAQVSPLSVSTSLDGASLVGAVAVADGLFVNPPLE
jgi:hypothetical protein